MIVGINHMRHRGMASHEYIPKAARLLAIAVIVVLASLASAGTYQVIPTGWSNLTGTASTYTGQQTMVSDSMGGSIMLTSLSGNNDFRLQGTWSFTVKWSRSTSGETAPPSAVIKIARLTKLSTDGNGVAEVLDGATILDHMDSSDIGLAGFVTWVGTSTLTVPLTLQSDGTYQGQGAVVSDTVVADWNSLNSVITTAEESLDIVDITGGN